MTTELVDINKISICSNDTRTKPSDLLKLQEILITGSYDIVIAGKLLQTWSNGRVKKYIVFERLKNSLHPLSLNPPSEHEPFLKERWNPFNSFFISKQSIWRHVPEKYKTNPDLLLKYSLKNKLNVFIADDVTAMETLKFFTVKKNLKGYVGSSFYLRIIAIRLTIFYSNIKSFFLKRKERQIYYTKIENIKKNKEIILNLHFGGLGDCLSFTSLPRLLKEQYNVDFYLDSKCKKIFRHKDIFNLCFGLNPYFKGFKECNDSFTLKDFIQDLPVRKLFSAHTNETTVEILERQFKLKGRGLPEIYYIPKNIPGYGKTLFVDNNWFSGEKWGLYNDPKLIEKEIENWLRDSTHNVEYCHTDRQNLFEYIDRMVSSGKFLCFLSGGNALAASLNLESTVIVPENLEGNSLSLFFYKKTRIKYIRNKPLDAYY